MKVKFVFLALCLLVSSVSLQGAESDRFKGGSYDGWAKQTTPVYASLTPAPRGTVIAIR